MKTIFFTLITISVITIYSSSTSKTDYVAKISVIIPELTSDYIGDINKEIQILNGVESQNINLDTKTLEMIVDYNSFSINNFKNSFDKWGWIFEDPIVEDIYY